MLSDNQGSFRITIPDDEATLIISYIGFVTQEVSVTDVPALM
ncbi:MAG: hypothetical protein R3B93_28280 [Bacteroidia bacterium]